MNRIPCPVWLTAVLAVFVVAGPPASAATNLLVNPGFEDGGGSYDGWTIGGNGIQLSTPAGDDIYRSGTTAAKLFGEFTGCPIPNFDVGVAYQTFTPVAGQIYEFSGYGYVDSGDPIPGTDPCAGNRCVAKISFFSAPVGGVELAVNEIIIGGPNTPLDQWLEFSVSAPAPPAAQRVEALLLFLQPGCDTGTVYVDDLSFTESPPPTPAPGNLLANPSFDTGLTGWTLFGANEFSENRGFAVRTTPGSAKMFGPFAAPGDASGMFQSFPATPGTEWLFKAWTLHTCQESPLSPTNLNYATAKIVFKDGTGTELDFAESIIADTNSPRGTWTQSQVAGIAPAGAVTVEALLIFIQPDSTAQGAFWFDDAEFFQTQVTDAPAIAQSVLDFDLRQNVPNPFEQSTQIDFVLSRTTPVQLSVYDVTGRRVTTLLERPLGPGPHRVEWDGTTLHGETAAAGVYQYVLKTSTGQRSKRMMLIK